MADYRPVAPRANPGEAPVAPTGKVNTGNNYRLWLELHKSEQWLGQALSRPILLHKLETIWGLVPHRKAWVFSKGRNCKGRYGRADGRRSP